MISGVRAIRLLIKNPAESAPVPAAVANPPGVTGSPRTAASIGYATTPVPAPSPPAAAAVRATCGSPPAW